MFLWENYGTIHCIFNDTLIVDVIKNDKMAFLFCCLVIVFPVFPPIDYLERLYSTKKPAKTKYLSYLCASHNLTEEYY